MTRQFTIGIIAGSGPDAGIDLWTKVLAAARARLGNDYRGDVDAPRVVVVSEPALGASMDLPVANTEVWAALEATAREIAAHCDVYVVACNTLNVYAPRLRRLGLTAELVSFQEAVGAWVAKVGVSEIGLLAARPVAELGEWSPYRELAEEVDVVTPGESEPLDDLIEAIKLDGGADPAHGHRLREIVDALAVERVLMACTELPLVAPSIDAIELVDVTDLVAKYLVRKVVGN